MRRLFILIVLLSAVVLVLAQSDTALRHYSSSVPAVITGGSSYTDSDAQGATGWVKDGDTTSTNLRVGIGTANPGCFVEISRRGTLTDTAFAVILDKYRINPIDSFFVFTSDGEFHVGNADGGGGLVLQNASGAKTLRTRVLGYEGAYLWLRSYGGGDIVIGSKNYGNVDLQVGTGSPPGTSALYVSGENDAKLGNIGFGTTSPDSGKVQIAGGIGAHSLWIGDNITYSYADEGDANFTTSSDSTKKENIIPVENLITKASLAQKILNVKVYRYNWNPDSIYVPFDSTAWAGWDSLTTVQKDSVELLYDTKETARVQKIASKNHFGFMAQNWAREFGGDGTKIDWQKVAMVQWYTTQLLIEEVIDLKQRMAALESP